MHSFYEIFPDCGALGGFFFGERGFDFWENWEIFLEGGVEEWWIFCWRLRVELFGWGRVNSLFVIILMLNVNVLHHYWTSIRETLKMVLAIKKSIFFS